MQPRRGGIRGWIDSATAAGCGGSSPDFAALHPGYGLASRDVSDFGPMQCAVLNPWQAG